MTLRNAISYISTVSNWYKLGAKLNISRERLKELAQEAHSNIQRKEKILLEWLNSPYASWKSLDGVVSSFEADEDYTVFTNWIGMCQRLFYEFPSRFQQETQTLEDYNTVFTLIRNWMKVYQRLINNFDYYSLQATQILNKIRKMQSSLISLEKEIQERKFGKDDISKLRTHEFYLDITTELVQQLLKREFAKLKKEAYFMSQISTILTTLKLWLWTIVTWVISIFLLFVGAIVVMALLGMS